MKVICKETFTIQSLQMLFFNITFRKYNKYTVKDVNCKRVLLHPFGDIGFDRIENYFEIVEE